MHIDVFDNEKVITLRRKNALERLRRRMRCARNLTKKSISQNSPDSTALRSQEQQLLA